MKFDPNNPVYKLCAQGMDMEGMGKPEEACKLFTQAWNEASNNLEKLTAAHYVARHQKDAADKLKWDQLALQFALTMDNSDTRELFPSLYLNVGKCHEDLGDILKARQSYEMALSFTTYLPHDGYGNMIRGGVRSGLERLSNP